MLPPGSLMLITLLHFSCGDPSAKLEPPLCRRVPLWLPPWTQTGCWLPASHSPPCLPCLMSLPLPPPLLPDTAQLGWWPRQACPEPSALGSHKAPSCRSTWQVAQTPARTHMDQAEHPLFGLQALPHLQRPTHHAGTFAAEHGGIANTMGCANQAPAQGQETAGDCHSFKTHELTRHSDQHLGKAQFSSFSLRNWEEKQTVTSKSKAEV